MKNANPKSQIYSEIGNRNKSEIGNQKLMLTVQYQDSQIVEIASDILEGQFKDRRLVTLRNQAEVDAKAEELRRILRGILALIP
ncbi:MAG TPA: hypothetical protein DCF33_05305 [Saprospirales bacterium]|nr:hypothetical protein [Saprospirales bacterium]